ncbi:MAG: SEC-C domain-containing protein, partial [Thiotrichales bacterium]|nr:SEC-C domain-containing protein [Thiotrichales bacterium]
GLQMDIQGWLDADQGMDEEKLRERIWQDVNKAVAEKEKMLPPELMRRLEKQIMLDVLDRFWKEHLVSMDMLRQGIHLRSYAAKNPKQEYKREAFQLFIEMLDGIKQEVIGIMFKIQIRDPESVEAVEQKQQKQTMQFNHPDAPDALNNTPEKPQERTPYVRQQRKIGRNEPCPCGSGKKYKQCHGKLA